MQTQNMQIINGEKVETEPAAPKPPPANPIDFPAPIGSGRRNRNRNSATEELPDFDFLNNMSNDWAKMTSKLTADQLPEGSQGSLWACLLYTSPSPRDGLLSRMPSSA